MKKILVAGGWTSTDFIIWAIVAVVGFLLFVWLADWVWNISRRTRLLKGQLDMLSEIAKAQGVSAERIESITREASAKRSLV